MTRTSRPANRRSRETRDKAGGRLSLSPSLLPSLPPSLLPPSTPPALSLNISRVRNPIFSHSLLSLALALAFVPFSLCFALALDFFLISSFLQRGKDAASCQPRRGNPLIVFTRPSAAYPQGAIALSARSRRSLQLRLPPGLNRPVDFCRSPKPAGLSGQACCVLAAEPQSNVAWSSDCVLRNQRMPAKPAHGSAAGPAPQRREITCRPCKDVCDMGLLLLLTGPDSQLAAGGLACWLSSMLAALLSYDLLNCSWPGQWAHLCTDN